MLETRRILAVSLLLLLFITSIGMARGEASQVISLMTTEAPKIDGNISEWNSTELLLTQINGTGVYKEVQFTVFFNSQHDGSYMYAYYDMINNTNPKPGDVINYSIDPNHDNDTLPQKDDWRLVIWLTKGMGLAAYFTYGNNKTWPSYICGRSPCNVTQAWTRGKSFNSQVPHLIIEFRLSLLCIVKSPRTSDTVKVDLRAGFVPTCPRDLKCPNQIIDINITRSNENDIRTWPDYVISESSFAPEFPLGMPMIVPMVVAVLAVAAISRKKRHTPIFS